MLFLNTFQEKLKLVSNRNQSLLCVGLDIDLSLLPPVDPLEFCKEIIDATNEFVCCYKPNLAFFESMGLAGWRLLENIVKIIPSGIPIIGDAKRGDIGSTAEAYAKALFEVFGFDAVTVNPYMGGDSLEPFLSYKNKGIFILCKTSNKGSKDLQDLVTETGKPVYVVVAEHSKRWNSNGNVGLVVGATYSEELKIVRDCCPYMPILIPGVGAQGGSLSAAVEFGTDGLGRNAIINSSRRILYGSSGDDFGNQAKIAAQSVRDEINSILTMHGWHWDQA